MTKYIAMFAVVLTTISGCAALGTLMDAARLLCNLTATEQSEAELAGMTPAEWCAVRENLEPFVEEAKRAKMAAGKKAGLQVE